MTDCTEARELLLDADLETLNGAGQSDLARHLSRCVGCRALAERVVRAEATVADALAGINPTKSTDALVAGARRAGPTYRWKPLRVALPLTAAAALATVLLWPRHAAWPGAPRPTPEPPRLAVEAPPGVNVAVFQTNNPKITVIWLYGGRQP